MDESAKSDVAVMGAQEESAYRSIREYVVAAQKSVYSAVNSAMVAAYWNIGKSIYEACGESDRAAYGKQVLEYISARLTHEFGKGYSVQSLRNMRSFYLAFQNRSTLWSELSWSHYQLLMRVEDDKARAFYAEESVKSGWSVSRSRGRGCSINLLALPYKLPTVDCRLASPCALFAIIFYIIWHAPKRGVAFLQRMLLAFPQSWQLVAGCSRNF